MRNQERTRAIVLGPVLAIAVITAGAPVAHAAADDDSACPMHAQHQAAAAAAAAPPIEERGDHTMGFRHAATTHHFLLAADGGTIQVEANDPADGASREHIRHHLAQIAASFAKGDFSSPLAIHDRVLPGISEMTRLHAAITYRYEETERGARVRITTANPQAVTAVHAFLSAQIEDHKTGDSH